MMTLDQGIRIYMDDAEILLMLDTVQLTTKAKEIENGGLLIYDSENPPERWIVQNFKGTGDEGWMLAICPHDSLKSLTARSILETIAKFWNLDTPNMRDKMGPISTHRPNPNRN